MLGKWVRGECIRGTLNTHFRVVKSILCESLGRRGRRLHTESTTYSQQVTRRGNGPYGGIPYARTSGISVLTQFFMEIPKI